MRSPGLALRCWVERPLRFERLGPIALGQAQRKEELKELLLGFVAVGRKERNLRSARLSGSSARYWRRKVKRTAVFCAQSELGLAFLALIMLVFFIVEGGGPLSLDGYWSKNKDTRSTGTRMP